MVHEGYSGMAALPQAQLAYFKSRCFPVRDFPVWDKSFSHSASKLYSHNCTVVLAARIWGLYGK